LEPDAALDAVPGRKLGAPRATDWESRRPWPGDRGGAPPIMTAPRPPPTARCADDRPSWMSARWMPGRTQRERKAELDCMILARRRSVTMLRLFLAPIKETLRHADQRDDGERLAATVRRNRAGVSLCCASTGLFILGATLEPYFNPANTGGGISFATFFTPVDIFVNSCGTLYTLRIDFVGSWLFGVAGTLQRDSWDSQKSLAAAVREAAASDADPRWRRWWRRSGASDDRAATWWWPRSDASDDRATFAMPAAMPAAPRRLEPSAPDRASAKPLPARSSTVESFEGANPSVQTEEALV